MSEMCKNRATLKRYWPGKEPDLVCVQHAEDTQRIARAMGFHVTFEPVGFAEMNDGELPACCCTAGFSQTIGG